MSDDVDASSLPRLDGRACGTENAEEKKWWEVEYLDGEVWRPDYLRHRTQSLAGALHECAKFQAEHPTRVRVVEVVERRMVVEIRDAGSSITDSANQRLAE